jgi:early secretory antigenic target protein ESAT-6
MSEIGVNFASLARTQGHIAHNVSAMNNQLNQLRDYLRPLVATWEGEAATTYVALQAKWDQAAYDLNQVLQQMAVATADANDAFAATERANAARFGG